ncbi:VOC family protein [Luedemannella flava]|uniref:VOC family protein n=1 Tax=Luedemannella flava TaxID=349316 RepID=UPI0031DA89AA
MSDEPLLNIGGFALLTGLTVTALRHYDEVGVLRPASVDPVTGYRRYRPGQVDQGRLIAALRRVDLPVEAMREALAGPAGPAPALDAHRSRLTARVEELTRMIEEVDRHLDRLTEGVAVASLKGSRIAQVTIRATDHAALVAFYEAAFDATYNAEIGSFEFGTWPDDAFFLLTVADAETHPGPDGPARFGLLVDDLDAAHRRALAAGGTEIYPPVKLRWKPRSSGVGDPSGNHIDLYQG